MRTIHCTTQGTLWQVWRSLSCPTTTFWLASGWSVTLGTKSYLCMWSAESWPCRSWSRLSWPSVYSWFGPRTTFGTLRETAGFPFSSAIRFQPMCFQQPPFALWQRSQLWSPGVNGHKSFRQAWQTNCTATASRRSAQTRTKRPALSRKAVKSITTVHLITRTIGAWARSQRSASTSFWGGVSKMRPDGLKKRKQILEIIAKKKSCPPWPRPIRILSRTGLFK